LSGIAAKYGIVFLMLTVLSACQTMDSRTKAETNTLLDFLSEVGRVSQGKSIGETSSVDAPLAGIQFMLNRPTQLEHNNNATTEFINHAGLIGYTEGKACAEIKAGLTALADHISALEIKNASEDAVQRSLLAPEHRNFVSYFGKLRNFKYRESVTILCNAPRYF
jgi:hypothetical protein